MSYIDLAIGAGFFLFFIAIVLGLSIQYFLQTPSQVNVEEYVKVATDMFTRFFSTSGTPSDWENTGEAPSELGLAENINEISLSVKEPDIAARTDEPVIAKLTFDEDCSNKTWNNTVRVYDSNLNEYQYELVDPVNCSGTQYLNESYVRFKVNMSKNEEKAFYIFYYRDDEIPGPNYTMSYSTGSWNPASGDSWSESKSSWDRYGGSSGSADTNTSGMSGAASIQVYGGFDNKKLGLKYEPASPITGVSNGWYADAWIYVDDITGISSVNVSVGDDTDIIMTSISSSSMNSEGWYHFEKNLTSSEWSSWDTFDASNGIYNITFYMVNSTADISRMLKVDGVHFEKEPLTVSVFPEESEQVISMKKISALMNLSYGELKEVTGEDYKFRVEIVES